MANKKTLYLLAAALAAGVSVAALSGCAAPPVTDYAGEKPVLDLARYFDGRVVAHGMFQDRFGKIAKRFTVVIDGRWNGGNGVLDEMAANGRWAELYDTHIKPYTGEDAPEPPLDAVRPERGFLTCPSSRSP